MLMSLISFPIYIKSEKIKVLGSVYSWVKLIESCLNVLSRVYTDRFMYVHACIFKQETFLTPVNTCTHTEHAKYKIKSDNMDIKY